jgi:sarcosine oxidase subunit gamma
MDELFRSGPLMGRMATHVVSVIPGTQIIFRGRDTAITMAGAAYGFPLPEMPCRARQQNGRAALWLGPDEFLLLAPLDQSSEILTELSAVLRHTPHALVDVGHRSTALQVSGHYATALLNAGCPLDLHESAFPIGACTRTILAKAQVILWHAGPELFYINTWRSFAAYVWTFLAEAERGAT